MPNKIVIRNNVFETNSSSMHTVVLCNRKDYASGSDFNDFIVAAKEMEECLHKAGYFVGQSAKYYPIPSFSDPDYYFGSSFQLFSNWEDKFIYLLAIPKYYKEQVALIDSVLNRIPEVDGIITSLSSDYEDTQNYFDSDRIIMPKDSLIDDSFGRVSYEGVSAIEGLVKCIRSNETFKNKTEAEIFEEIIFSNKYIIVTDSDEANNFLHAYKKGLFRDAGFEYILSYKYNDEDDVDERYTYYFNSISDYVNRYFRSSED